MTIDIHPSATANFNERADALLLELAPATQPGAMGAQRSFNPDIIPRAQFSSDDVQNLTHRIADPAGRTLARYFKYVERDIGLAQEAYRQLVRLCETVHRSKGIRDLLSYATIEDTLFEWMVARYKGEITASMLDFALEQWQTQLREFTVWLPVATLHVQSPILIGKVTIQPFTRDFFEQFQDDQSRRAADQPESPEYKYVEGLKVEYQGRAAATLTMYGELRRVVEVATEEAEQALAMLRLFSAAAFIPGVVSYCRLEGRQNSETYNYFAVNDGSFHFGNGGVDPSFSEWMIPDDVIEIMEQSGLRVLSDLLNLDKGTEFEQALRESLLAYSRHTLAKELSDKLLYIFTALDSFLLKGENEPIQQNISERIACVVGANGPDRRKVIKTIKDMYSLRSKFVHHNQQVDDLDTLGDFLNIVWRFYLNLILNHNGFSTKESFINALEDRRLSY